MDSKTRGLIITIVAGVLFGCPGLFLIAFGIIALLPDPANPLSLGGIEVAVVSLIFGAILVIVPITVGFFTLHTKPEAPDSSNQPIPPAS